MSNSHPEVWLRGPLQDMPALLQPVAHSLLQCLEEFTTVLNALTPEQIWTRPGGAASVGFHARHAAGSLDRLLTYARGEDLSAAQFAALAHEGDQDATPNTGPTLLGELNASITRAFAQLRATRDSSLLEPRAVGRARLPSTVLGLLFHAAEHTQRHAGQAVTTARVLAGR